jgi:transposase
MIVMKYTIRDFRSQFPDDDTCLEYLFLARFGNKSTYCQKCRKTATFNRVRGRKTYACSWCGAHVSPTAGTIFHKSETPLTLWFHAIFLMSLSKNGVSAKEIQRQVGVGYKTAFRMMHQIRKLMEQDSNSFTGITEADETYVGGKRRGKRGRGASGKTPVFGLSNRDTGKVFAKAVPNVRSSTVMPLIRQNVQIGSTVMTDEFTIYNTSKKNGYKHKRVNHGKGQYVRGDVSTNQIEGFWSQLKRSIDGTHHAVSGKLLQRYVDEHAFRWNHRSDQVHLFQTLLARV